MAKTELFLIQLEGRKKVVHLRVISKALNRPQHYLEQSSRVHLRAAQNPIKRQLGHAV